MLGISVASGVGLWVISGPPWAVFGSCVAAFDDAGAPNCCEMVCIVTMTCRVDIWLRVVDSSPWREFRRIVQKLRKFSPKDNKLVLK